MYGLMEFWKRRRGIMVVKKRVVFSVAFVALLVVAGVYSMTNGYQLAPGVEYNTDGGEIFI